MKENKKKTKKLTDNDLRKQIKEMEKIDPVDAYRMKQDLGLYQPRKNKSDGFYC